MVMLITILPQAASWGRTVARQTPACRDSSHSRRGLLALVGRVNPELTRTDQVGQCQPWHGGCSWLGVTATLAAKADLTQNAQ
jgi:hypothetical protein